MSTTLNTFLATVLGLFILIGIVTSGSTGFDIPGNDNVTVNKIHKGAKKLMKSEQINYKSGMKESNKFLNDIGIGFGS